MGKIFIAAGLALGLSFGVFASDASASSGKAAPSQEWTFDGVFGNFDRAQLKRGYQVYQEVCAACHSLSQIYYRNLSEIGFTEDEVKKIAAEFEVPRGPDDEGETHEDGEQIMRAAKPFDKLVQPYANEQAARAANNGALPPDLSLVTKARKSVAGFKIREGWPIGCKVTLRNRRMYEFLERLVSVAIPRVRDFRGLNPKSFDGRGNYSMGLREQIVFPEINYDEVDEIRGLDVIICTTADSDDEARELLRGFEMPFRE